MENEIRHSYIVYDIRPETPDVSTIRLVCKNTELPEFIPGQFITVYLPDLGTPQGKAYSISSTPNERIISISVKKIGLFSKHITSLMPGDIVHTSAPSGYFYSESYTTPLVMIAGGIGVAPFRSIIVDILNRNPERNVSLFYSNKTVPDIVFKNEFDALQHYMPNFKAHYFITQDPQISGDMNIGRINGKKILQKTDGKSDTEFLICGSISFTRDIWKELKSLSVPEETMYTEAFFSH